MFRRSRLSVRPNVGTAGRTAGAPQEASSNKDPDNATTTSETPASVETPLSVTDNQPEDPPTEQTPGIDQNGEAASSSAIQRRKRFSVRPKVVPGRPSALPRTPKSPIKPVLPAVKSPPPVVDKAATLIEVNCTAPPQEEPPPKEIQSPDESRLLKTDTVSPSEGSSKCIEKIQTSSCSQVKEVCPKTPVPPSIPDRESMDISEKAKTLVSKAELRTSSQHFSLTQLLNDKSDLLRLEKAKKLRQLLKQEMLKEKSKKCASRVKELTLDPSKMTMRDLIHYLPTSNPMSSTLEESVQENETTIPQSPGREISPERAQEHEVPVKMPSPSQGEATATTSADGEQEPEDEEAEEDDEALMVPQVKVAEDGSLIIDEESLTVEVQRMKGPNPIQDRDPIFERGSTTTYSSFRKGTHTKPWSTEETDMFFLAISMVGTDFAMISQLFPHRARTEIKNKFKKEERFNAWRIDKAFRERRKLDLVYFNKLLEKILEYQKSKKQLKLISEKPKIRKIKPKAKAVAELSDVEEENEDAVAIEEQEGEKENLCNEKTPSSQTKRKRKNKDDPSPESPNDKKKKRKTKKLPDDMNDFADLEDSPIPQDHQSLDQSKKTESQAAKPAEPKSLPLGRKGQKAKKSKAVVSADSEAEPTNEETEIAKDNVLSPQSAKRTSDNDSSDHETTVQTARPSRYGRIPKPVQPLNYPAKDDTNSSASDSQSTTAAKAKNKTKGKRGRSAQQKATKESKKPKLIMLRASQSEGSDDDDEEEADALHYDDDNGTSAFVPASLCSPKPVVPEVEETMEELDMLAHMPDVLGMSENALFPDASCEQVQNEGTVEPCEHQLDLLVDVIDFLSENAEASDDESYNEAAQTLLAIGNLAQPTESQPSSSDHISKLESSPYIEVDDFSKPPFEQEECAALVSEPSGTENISTNSPLEPPAMSFTYDTQAFKPVEDLSCADVSTSRAENSGSPSRKEELSKWTTELLAQTISATVEKQQEEEEIATTTQQQYLENPEESTLTVSEPTQTNSTSTDDTAVVPSHVSNAQNDGPCSKEDTVDSLQLQKTPNTTTTSSPSIRQRWTRIKPNISGALRTTKQNVEAVEEKTPVESEMASTNDIGSLIESSQAVSKQNESCSTQETAANSQPENTCSNNSSTQPKGRFSKIKPKPNIGCATRTTKQSTQSVHAIEEKSSKLEEESSEQSSCQNKTPSSTEETPECHSSDIPVMEPSDESNSTQETVTSSQLETISSENCSSAPRKGRFSKIKPKPNFERASRTAKLSPQSVHAHEEKLQNEPEMASISLPDSSKHEVEPPQKVLEQSKCHKTVTSSTNDEMPECHAPSKQVGEHSDESSSTQEAASSSQILTISSEISSSALNKGRLSRIKPKPNIGCATRTTKQSTQSVHIIEEKLLNQSEMTSTSQLSSSKSEIESTQIVSEQSICPNKTTSSAEEMPESHLFDLPVIEPSDESSSTQETAGSSQLVTVSSENSSSMLKKGRLSRIKPKPNIGGPSRTSKQPSQSVHALEEKLLTQSEITSTSQLSSSKSEVESAQIVSEQSSCPDKTTSSTEEMPECPSLDLPVIEPSDESSSTQETAGSSQMETASSENSSSVLRKGKLSRIKPKPNIGDPSRTAKQPSQSVHALEEKLLNQSEMTSTSQLSSSKSEVESTQIVSEQSSCPNKTTSRVEEMPESPSSDLPIIEPSDESSSTQETAGSSQIETANSENSSSVLRKGRLSKIKPKPNIGGPSRTAKQPSQSVHALEEKLLNQSEVASTSRPDSSKYEVESTRTVSEQSSSQNNTTSSTEEAIATSHVIKDSDELRTTQEAAGSTQLEALCSENSSSPLRKGRFSRLKPKPNIGSASRITKQSSQSDHAIEQKSKNEPEIESISQPDSSKPEVESTQIVLEQSSRQNQITSSAKEDMSESHASSKQVHEHNDDSSSTQETAGSSQIETISNENSTSMLRKGRLSRIKPKPNIESASRTARQPSQSVHAIEEKIRKEPEVASTSHPDSSKPEVESTQIVLEQSSRQNKTTSSTEEEMTESSSTQETTAASQAETLCSKTSSTLRKGRFSKIKPKPNIERASRTTKQSSQSADTTELQTVGETATASEGPLSASVESFGEFHQESLNVPCKGTEALTHGQIGKPSEQGESPSTFEKHVSQFTEESFTPSDQSAIEPLDRPRPAENVIPLEPEIIPSTQFAHSSLEEKTENITPVRLFDPSSESLKHSTPQRRRWVPKIKPKPNLVSSPRTAKPRVESKEKCDATEQFVQSSILTATSEQPMLQEPHDHFQPVTVEPNSTSSVSSLLDVSLSEIDQTQLAAGSDSTNTSTSKSTEEMIVVSRTEKIYEDPTTVQDQCEPATNQMDVDHCSLIECAPSDFPKSSSTVYQLQDLTVKNTEICLETSEISIDHTQPAEGAVEPPTELQHSDAALPLGFSQTQDSFEFKSLLFSNIPPDQVPSDPDEPFFILSLTEIPVCPSGEEVNPMPEPYHPLPETGAQQSNPVHAAGIDDSLANIYIPTPEKATLKSGLIRVEEYLPSAPSKDISILEEPRERRSKQRPNLPDDEPKIEIQESLSANEPPSAEDDVKESTKAANKKTTSYETASQDPPESFTQIKNNEEVDSEAQKDIDGSSVVDTRKMTETRGNKSQAKKSKASSASLWGRTETQSSDAKTAEFFTCSLSSKDNHSTSPSERLEPTVKDSTNVLDEGPSSVSEFFFCDVFTEVDGDCSVAGNLPGDTVCHDKTQSQPADTEVNLSQHSHSPCGQTSPTTAPQKSEAAADDVSSCHLPDSSTSDTNAQPCQQDNKRSQGGGRGNRKNKTSSEVKAETTRPQRKSRASKLHEALSQDSFTESTSSSSTVAPQTLEVKETRTSEAESSHQTQLGASAGSSVLEEPTNVSKYLSDVFMEVEGAKVPRNSSSDITPSQNVETKVNKRQTRRKGSSVPPSRQDRSLTEDETSLRTSQKTPSSSGVTAADSSQKEMKKTRGKGASKKSLKKSAEALKSPQAVGQDTLKEAQSSASAGQTQKQPESGSTEVPVLPPVEDTSKSSATRTRSKGKTPTQTRETNQNTRKRKTKASSCALIQEQAPEASLSPDVQKPSVNLTGKGRLHETNKPSGGAQQQKQVRKSPARITEAPSTSSAVQLEIQQNNQSDNDEPTNVSQFFLSDIFTDVDEEFKS